MMFSKWRCLFSWISRLVSPKHTNITESSEKQEPDGRSSVMLSCTSHSFPPVHNYSWYRKSQGEEKDELVSEHPNHTVYSDQSGVYYCIAENEEDQSLSDPVHLFEREWISRPHNCVCYCSGDKWEVYIRSCFQVVCPYVPCPTSFAQTHK